MGNLCFELHTVFNEMKRYTYEEIDNLPFENGIYIVFEKGEKYKGKDRIVRVGTHREDGRLKLRLKYHFVSGNRNSSVFRKNVGKAILQKNSAFSPLSTDEKSYDDKLKEAEKEISKYMRENMTFTAFPVADKDRRLRFEAGIIASVYKSGQMCASENWLGLYSPDAKIRKCKMWLSQGLNANILTDEELKELKTLCSEVR